MNGPSEIDEVPCTCRNAADRVAGVFRRVPAARPGRQWRCRRCDGVAPLQPGAAAVTTGVGWPAASAESARCIDEWRTL